MEEMMNYKNVSDSAISAFCLIMYITLISNTNKIESAIFVDTTKTIIKDLLEELRVRKVTQPLTQEDYDKLRSFKSKFNITHGMKRNVIFSLYRHYCENAHLSIFEHVFDKQGVQ